MLESGWFPDSEGEEEGSEQKWKDRVEDFCGALKRGPRGENSGATLRQEAVERPKTVLGNFRGEQFEAGRSWGAAVHGVGWSAAVVERRPREPLVFHSTPLRARLRTPSNRPLCFLHDHGVYEISDLDLLPISRFLSTPLENGEREEIPTLQGNSNSSASPNCTALITFRSPSFYAPSACV